ncbi:MAG: BatA domain-containing protein [Crocinitomicaceae bacterium]|nr:BatA domain-containing protein [Crocinitomicaceae bacterium]
MKFVHPSFLWALSLLIVPIIIHLFSFRKYKTLHFSSLKFIQQVEKQNKSTQKLKNLLILIARLLTLTFIVLGFAQPYFNNSASSKQNNSSVFCIHIDNSFSMTMKGVEGELLSEAKESAKKLVNKAPLNTKIMLSTNALEGIESHITTKIEALERIDKIQPSPMVRSFDEVIKWQKNNLQNTIQLEKTNQIQHIYLSDFQKNTNHFENLTSDSIAQYIPIRFVSQNKSNLSVDSVWFSSPLHKVGTNNELFIKISNHGDEDLQNVQIQFESSNLRRDLFIDLPKGETSTTSLSFSPKKSGIHTGVVKIADKQFYADDEYYFSYKVAEKSSILIINGPDENKNLASIYRLDNFYNVTEINQSAFIQNHLQNIDLVVLNGINELATSFNSALSDYNKNGGSIAIFLGKTIDKNSINSFLSNLKLPLIQKEITQSSRINKLSYNDYFFKGVFDKDNDKISLPAVTKFYLTDQSSADAVSLVQMQNGKSLFYRTPQKQQAFLFTSVLHPDYGSFITDILYTTIVLRIGELSLKNAPSSVIIGVTNNYPIYSKIVADRPIILNNDKIEFIPSKKTLGTMSSIDLSGIEAISILKSGIYDVINNGHLLDKIAINYNREESDIHTWSEKEITEMMKRADLQHINFINVDKGANSVDLNIEKPYPYWKFFISFALVFLLAELLILKLWKNKIEN